MDRSPWNFYVFRETHRHLPAPALLTGLLDDVSARRDDDALVRAGEIESALADAGAHEAATAASMTDVLATAVVTGRACEVERVRPGAGRLSAVAGLRIVPPESFSYYGLHPLDFAARAAQPPLDKVQRAAVVGLRSIGTTLSAVVCAAMRSRGVVAERRTVRPHGEPYARSLTLSSEETAWVRRHARDGSEFVVVDEGPGLSGSTFLAAVDALVACGAAPDRVTVMGTREPDPSQLLARDGARRWRSLRTATVSCSPRVPPGYTPMPPGRWRQRFLSAGARWPACWPWLERAKAIAPDAAALVKFEGLGRFGADALRRAAAAADAGFAPPARRVAYGRVSYRVVRGWPADASRLDERTIERLADYCAWRARELGPEGPGGAGVDVSALGEMARVNAATAFGVDFHPRLVVERPVVADARMMPFEWIEDGAGGLWKTDAASHGDDHLFPGLTDAAWDLAGAIVEWRMPRPAADRFLALYARRAGDQPAPRLPAWLATYALHRLGWAELARATVEGSTEAARLARDADARRRWIRAAARCGLLGQGDPAMQAVAESA